MRKVKSAGKRRSTPEPFQGTCRNCGKAGHKWSECWAKGGGAAKQANSVGESEKAGDVNWIMMIQQMSDDYASAKRHEDWRCSGTLVSCQSAHDSRVDIHAESDHIIPNPNIAESVPTQQSTVDHAHQPYTRLASVNPVILSNTAKLVVDSRCFDHCCPLDFATQFELKEGRFLNASAANTIKLKHYGTRVVEGWTRDVNGAEIPLKIRFNVFDVKSPLLSTSKLRKHGFSVVLDRQQTILKGGTTIELTDQNGLPTLELRLASRPGEIDERMCAPVEEIGEEARKATPMFVPRGPSDAEGRAHEIHHMPYRSWCEYCVRGRGKESPHLSREEQADESIPVVQLDYVFLHDTGNKDAEVTFLTMIDTTSGAMVATAVQKKGHDKFVERFSVEGSRVIRSDR